MKRIIYFALFLVLITISNVDAKNTIKWIITMEPPITYQEDGKYVGYGIKVLDIIQKNMEDYKNEIEVAGNYNRLTSEVQKGPLTCAIGLFKTEDRLKNMYFSKVPVFYFFNVQIVLRRNMFEKLKNHEAISLNSMLEQNNYKLGISKGRTYSDTIRDLLKKYEGSKNIYIGSQGNVAESLLQMLIKKRIDYMFLYPEEAIYLSRKLGYGKDIITVPIKEASNLGYSWAVCTKNDEGEKVISKISELLIDIRKKIHIVHYTKHGFPRIYYKHIVKNIVKTFYRYMKNRIFLIFYTHDCLLK